MVIHIAGQVIKQRDVCSAVGIDFYRVAWMKTVFRLSRLILDQLTEKFSGYVE
jgi:hypothetical protein